MLLLIFLADLAGAGGPRGEAGLHGAGRECTVRGVCIDEGTECCC